MPKVISRTSKRILSQPDPVMSVSSILSRVTRQPMRRMEQMVALQKSQCQISRGRRPSVLQNTYCENKREEYLVRTSRLQPPDYGNRKRKNDEIVNNMHKTRPRACLRHIGTLTRFHGIPELVEGNARSHSPTKNGDPPSTTKSHDAVACDAKPASDAEKTNIKDQYGGLDCQHSTRPQRAERYQVFICISGQGREMDSRHVQTYLEEGDQVIRLQLCYGNP